MIKHIITEGTEIQSANGSFIAPIDFEVEGYFARGGDEFQFYGSQIGARDRDRTFWIDGWEVEAQKCGTEGCGANICKRCGGCEKQNCYCNQ